MKIKIENKPMDRCEKKFCKHDLTGFVQTIAKLKIGQSFVVDKIPSHYRIAISVAQTLLNVQFVTRKENEKFRVGRTA